MKVFSSQLSIKFANKKRREIIENFIEDFQFVVKFYVKKHWNSVIKSMDAYKNELAKIKVPTPTGNAEKDLVTARKLYREWSTAPSPRPRTYVLVRFARFFDELEKVKP